jgi:16S rRNA A1518/A1519 N6-dimethyltransferase RsmA/KsgA/DIM1 with predicted DNA glycosylase/AP lyase activity
LNYTEPHVPVPLDVIPKMLELARLKPADTLYELGAGDGRIVIVAARDFHAKVVGVEIRRRLALECRRRVKELGLAGQVRILRSNFKKVSLRRADVLATYLSSYTLNLLTPKFERELKPGARIVNFDYPIPSWKAHRELSIRPEGWRTSHPIYLYLASRPPPVLKDP